MNYCLGDFGEMGTKMTTTQTNYLYKKLSDGSGQIYAVSTSVGRSVPQVTNLLKPVKIPASTMNKYSNSKIPNAILSGLVKNSTSAFDRLMSSANSIFSSASSVLSSTGKFAVNAGNMALDKIKPTISAIQNYDKKPVKTVSQNSAPVKVLSSSTSSPQVLNSTNSFKNIEMPQENKMNVTTMAVGAAAVAGIAAIFLLRD